MELTVAFSSSTKFVEKVGFPEGITVDQIRQAIEGDDTFIEVRRDGFVAFDYRRYSFATFPDPNRAPDEFTRTKWQLRRECRGIKFSDEGRLLCRPYHKFWSIDERPESAFKHIQCDEIESVIVKYDGELIAPVLLNGRIQFLSRTGRSSSALNSFLQGSTEYQYKDFARRLIAQDLTPMFEFCSDHTRHVTFYPREMLMLTGIRNNITGEYHSYSEMKDAAASFDIPIAEQWPGRISSHSQLHLLKGLINYEGFVLKMMNGSLLKLKTDWWKQHSNKTT